MMSRRSAMLGMIAAMAGAMVLTGCGPSTEDRTELRYRLSVEVDTPQGVRTGSSVIEVTGGRNPSWVNPEGRGTRGRYRGEAVAVDLPGGEVLFALLRSESGFTNANNWPIMAYRDILRADADFVTNLKQLAKIPPVSVVKPLPKTDRVLGNGGRDVSALPMLVRFGDIGDPASVELVDPDDLAASFGEGYRLKAITAEVTEDPVTTGIAEKLHAQGIQEGHGLDRTKGVTANPSLAQQIGYSDFKRE